MNSSESPSLARRLGLAATTAADVAAYLDGLSADERVAQCRRLTGLLQRQLWKLCAGAPPLKPDDLLTGASGTVIWAGKNSLPMFSIFEKRFARVDGAVVGYNHQSMSWFSGPGFFTALPSALDPNEIVFDYTRLPSMAPDGWPALKSNDGGTARLVYGGMKDYVRRVSRDVLISQATRRNKEMNSYFILART
jgi:hypothetical protein